MAKFSKYLTGCAALHTGAVECADAAALKQWIQDKEMETW